MDQQMQFQKQLKALKEYTAFYEEYSKNMKRFDEQYKQVNGIEETPNDKKQLRENNSLFQDYMKDLKNWGEEMSKKDTFLNKTDKGEAATTSKLRKTDKPEKKKSGAPKINKPATKSHATDYAAWDKFDVDAELDRLEDDANEDSELTDECSDMQEEALVEKEKGNKFVKSQNWDQAIKCYTKAINCYSYDPVFFANRALCYLKKENFEEAEQDCTLSLKLDSTYVKAYQRRAAARQGLNKLEYAEYDLIKVLELEPKNKESKLSLENLRKKMGKVEKPPEQRPISKFTASRNKVHNKNSVPTVLPQKIDSPITETKKNFDTSTPIPSWPEEKNILIVKPVNKPPHMRSKKPLKRVEIREVNGPKIEKAKEPDKATLEPEAVKKHVFEKQEKLEKIIEGAPEVMSAFKKRNSNNILEKTEHFTALPKPDVQSACLKSDDFKIIEKKVPADLTNLPGITKEVKNTSNINISSSECKNSAETTDADLAVPKTSVQFYLTWKNLKTSEEKYKFLKLIEPKEFPKIFLNSLESNIFSNILEVLVKHFLENKECVYSILDNFTQVKRFATFTMFMSSTDKNNLLKLFDYMKEREDKSLEGLDMLRQKYEL